MNLNQEGLNEKELESNLDLEEGIDFSNIRLTQSKSMSRDKSDAGVMSIINSKKCGKRITFSKELVTRLGNPGSVQIAFLNSDSIAVAKQFSDGQNSYKFKTGEGKPVLYASELVLEIASEFGLDFTDRTSITFHEAKYTMYGESVVAVIKMKK